MVIEDFRKNLDSDQRTIYLLSLERTIVVSGMAGSGKSWLLLAKAKQASVITDSFAIVVYTKTLKQFFVDQLKEIDPKGERVYYWEECKRSYMNRTHYDFLFIDECQDFNKEEIDFFRNHGTYCWFFGDTDQSIMRFPKHEVQSVQCTAKQLGIHEQTLPWNHRLTIENAKVGEYIIPQTHLSDACLKHGELPFLVQTDNQLDFISDMKEKQDLSNVCILVYYSDEVEALRDYYLKKGLPVEWKTHDEMEIDLKSHNLKIINWHCAKGLEFNDVFIPFCGIGDYKPFIKPDNRGWDPMTAPDRIPALYVATTRPLDRLYLLYTGPLSLRLPPQDSSIYNKLSDASLLVALAALSNMDGVIVEEEEWLDF